MRLIYLTLLSSLILLSCGDPKKPDNTNTNTVDENMVVTDLSEYELPLSITTEKSWDQSGEETTLNIEHEEADVLWSLTLGDRFNIIIEDWTGVEKNATEEVERKASTQQPLVFDYVSKDDELVVYSISTPDSEKKEFHFYKVIKGEGDQLYTVVSNPMNTYTKEEIDIMLKAANTLKVAEQTTTEDLES